MIRHKTARKLLYAWHGGQWSLEYSAASSGLVEKPFLLFNSLQLSRDNTTPKNALELSKLLEYLDFYLNKKANTVNISGENYLILAWYKQ